MNQGRRGIRINIVLILYVVVFLVLFEYLSSSWKSSDTETVVTEWTVAELTEALEAGEVAVATISPSENLPTGTVTVITTADAEHTITVLNVETMEELLGAYPTVTVAIEEVAVSTDYSSWLIPGAFLLVLVVMLVMQRQQQGGGGNNSKMMNFGKSRARMISPDAKRVTLDQVAGLKEEKEDLEEVISFLKEPQKFIQIGARIPKGILLVGPPGTGKTLLAKAVAGEAGVPFFSISGSDFVEMFVGVGASRVRDLFEEAKHHQPCIIFIDEIDAVARRRGTGMGGGHDEREQTLNQLLVEMDGFGVNEGIIVMAATNRVDILDPAIMRPGRFDRQVAVGRPDVRGREEILQVHARNKPLGDDVDLAKVAQTTAGFAGADLENLMNEAAIMAAKEDRMFICQRDIDRAFIKVGIGAEKKSRVISEKEKRITAYHESGHAICFHLLPDVGPVHTVSIIPTGRGAAGYTMPLPEKDEMFHTKGQMEQNLVVCLGGRVAEELILGDVTTGASQDIKQATATARAMVTKYGMSERVGLLNYDTDEDEVFIGRDLAHTRSYGEEIASLIDEEVKRLVDEAHEKARELILENLDVLHASAALLIAKEKIGREEFEALFSEKPAEICAE